MNLICNKKGFTLIEVMISIILLVIGILSLMSLFPQGYILGSKSDLIARAATLLREELEMQELQIMNSCNNINTSTNSRSVYLSGQGTAQTGDISFIVQTNITNIGVNIWRVNVRVIGPNNYPNITESLVVTRQLYYRHGC